MKKKKHVISSVLPGSIGEELELEPGDVLAEINHQPVEDVFDYRYLLNDEYIELLIEKANGEFWELEVEKDYDEDLGIEFENGLMDDYRSCSNHCMFCFIDQMPPGMRETLYFKDDDSRLSFLQGNYVTLTNMSQEDIDRVIKYHLSPINVSFQAMNPKLRCKMLHNRFAGDALKKVDQLYEAGITMNGQIVLCKGVNDGEELEYSLQEMAKYAPVLQSVSVVPVGLTKFRDGLYPLESLQIQRQCFAMSSTSFSYVLLRLKGYTNPGQAAPRSLRTIRPSKLLRSFRRSSSRVSSAAISIISIRNSCLLYIRIRIQSHLQRQCP